MKKTCVECGASMMEYKHGLSKGIVQGLIKLAKKGKPVNLQLLELTRNQWDNFQKLRYWDLVAKHGGNSKGGVWEVTPKGYQFVKGEIAVPKSAWTYRGERTKFDGDLTFIGQVVDGYKYKPDYSDEAEPHGDEGDLFGG